MKKSIEIISFVIIVFFAFIGMLFIGGLTHEFSHYFDIHKYANEGDYICAWVITTNFNTLFSDPSAYYSYSINQTKEVDHLEDYENADKFTELKAYSIQIGIAIIFTICLIIVFKRRNDLKDDEDIVKVLIEVMTNEEKKRIEERKKLG